MPRVGIQLCCSTNCIPPPILYSTVTNTRRTVEPSEVPSATPFISASLAFEVKRMKIPPTNGRKMIRLSIVRLRLDSAFSSPSSTLRSPSPRPGGVGDDRALADYPKDREDDHAEGDHQQVIFRAPRLDTAQGAADGLGDPTQQVDGAIHHIQVHDAI